MSADEMTLSEARADLGPVTERAEFGGEITYLAEIAENPRPRGCNPLRGMKEFCVFG